MRNPTGRRPPSELFIPKSNHRLTTPKPLDPRQFNVGSGGGGTRRNSDVSYRNRPSSCYSAGVNHRHSTSTVDVTDRSYQNKAISTINSYFSDSSFSISFKLKPPPSLPTTKEITETLNFLLSRLQYLPSNNKMEDDVFIVLKCLKCPIKINKSALKPPVTPHTFPSVLAVLHWLVQIAIYNDHLVNSTQSQSTEKSQQTTSEMIKSGVPKSGLSFTTFRFGKNIKSGREKSVLEENIKVKLEDVKDLEAKLEAMKSEPSLRGESKEEEQGTLEKDIKKFNELIEQLQSHVVSMDKLMEEKEQELGIKMEERTRICEENDELKKKVEEQAMNTRDAERIKRELQSAERYVEEAEIERNKWEQKCWDLDAVMGTKLNELEALQIECNQFMRRLKLGNDFQYELNAKGLTPAEVLGMDYKSTLKPALNYAGDEVKRTSMENYKSLMFLQQLSRDITAKIDAKRDRIATLQSRIESVGTRINLINKETQKYTSMCAMEPRKLVENFQAESHKMDVVEKEARELVENSKAKLQETMTRNEEEVQMCAHELLALIDSVSKCKELMVSKLSQMKNDVSETAVAIAQIHKASLTSSIGI